MWLLLLIAICVAAYLATRDPFWAKVVSRGLLCLSALWIIGIAALIGSWAPANTLWAAALLPPFATIVGVKTLAWVFSA